MKKVMSVLVAMVALVLMTGNAMADVVYTTSNYQDYLSVRYGFTSSNGFFTLNFTFDGAANENVWVVGESTLADGTKVYNVTGYNAIEGSAFQFFVRGYEEDIPDIDGFYVILDGGDRELFSVNSEGELNFNIGDNTVYRQNIVSIDGLPFGDTAFGYYGPGRKPYKLSSVVMDTSYACDSDSDCDDDLFCNGVESCYNGLCEAGASPCDNETETCNEDADKCIAPECYTNSDCDDDLFCNGVEVCVVGSCVAGVTPCEVGEICDENADQCFVEPECYTNSDCDDDLFCNGEEICSAGSCIAGVFPCEEDETCNEGADQCVFNGCSEWDLDGDCDVDKDDFKILKLNQKVEKKELRDYQKAEKTDMKEFHKSERENLKPILTKDEFKALLLSQKVEKIDMRNRHKSEKDNLKSEQLAQRYELIESYTS